MSVFERKPFVPKEKIEGGASNGLPRCQHVRLNGFSSRVQCPRRARITEAGKTWCGIHAPSAYEKRSKKADAAFAKRCEENRLAREAAKRNADAAKRLDEIEAALKELCRRLANPVSMRDQMEVAELKNLGLWREPQ